MIEYMLSIYSEKRKKKWKKEQESCGFMLKSMVIGDGRYKVISNMLNNTFEITRNKQYRKFWEQLPQMKNANFITL